MIKEMHGWKVIKRSTRCSARARGWFNVGCDWGIRYPFGEEVKPNVKDTKLFFFKDRKDAFDFAGPTEIVVPCIAYNAVQVKWVCRYPSNAHRFWRLRSKANKKIKYLAPEGTWVAESLICLE